MKIVHIVDSMETGGAEVLVAHLCRQQRDRGDLPSVHCLLRVGAIGERLQAAGIEVSLSRPGKMARDWDVWKTLRRIRPDVVHCHNANATIHGALWARLAGVKKVITTRHGLVEPGGKATLEKRFWFSARFCDHVVAVCEMTARNLELGPGAIPSKIVTVRNGTAPAPNGDGPALEKAGLQLISVGRLVPAKDQATLLKAMAIARTRLSDLQVWIVGDGPLRGQLSDLVRALNLEECVHLVGERQDAGRWLHAADLFVLSSVSEGLPVSVLEAMAAGLPLLLTDVGGMPEMVKLAGGGRIVRPSDPDGMAQTIVEMAEDRSRLRSWGAANQTMYRSQLTERSMDERYDRLYRS